MAAEMLPEIGRPVRIDDFGEIAGTIPEAIRASGMRSGAGAAIVVDGELWGTMGSACRKARPCRTTSRIDSRSSRS